MIGTAMKILLVIIIIGAIIVVLEATGLLQLVINTLTSLFNGIINAIMGLFPH